MTDNTLEPCPFCGSEDVGFAHELPGGGRWMVQCLYANCYANSGTAYDKELVRQRWNSRSPASGIARDQIVSKNEAVVNLEAFFKYVRGEDDYEEGSQYWKGKLSGIETCIQMVKNSKESSLPAKDVCPKCGGMTRDAGAYDRVCLCDRQEAKDDERVRIAIEALERISADNEAHYDHTNPNCAGCVAEEALTALRQQGKKGG